MKKIALDIRPFTRLIWKNKEAKEEWLPKINQASRLYNITEWKMVSEGLRKCGTVHINKNNFEGMLRRLEEDEMFFKPISRTAKYQGFCLTGDSLIYTNPNFKRLDEIEVGDKLNRGEVVAINSQISSELVIIKPHFLEAIGFTPNHRILIGEKEKNLWGIRGRIKELKWKLAQDVIRLSDCVVVPKLNFENKEINIDLVRYAFRKNYRIASNLKLDTDLAWVFGWYLAEGCVSTLRHKSKNGRIDEEKRIIFSLNREKEQGVAEKLKHIIERKFKIGAWIQNGKDGSLTVTCSSNLLGRFLINSFGKRAKNKKIPNFIFQAKKKLIWDFLCAYICGDGCKIKKGRNLTTVISSVSKGLIKQIQMLLLKFGIVSSFTEVNQNSTFGRTHRFVLGYIRNSLRNRFYLEDEKNFYFPINKIEKRNGRFQTYDLETSNGLFEVPFIIHNSHRHIIPKKGESFDIYGVICKNKDDCDAFAKWSNSGNIEIHNEIGKLLKYPDCCSKAFTERWNKGIIDPMFEAAWAMKNSTYHNEFKNGGKIDVIDIDKIPIETNQMLRYIGIRLTSHLPCSFDCQKTKEIAKDWIKVMKETDLEGFKYLKELLSLDFSWNAYYGIVEVDNKLFRAITTTGFDKTKKIINVGEYGRELET